MRIVSGEHKGRVIEAPGGRATRPTTDRVRESMFSAVYSRLPDLSAVSVLDAFAGSGALGFEALSRGAATCTFFERDRTAQRVIEANAASLGVARSRWQLVKADVFAGNARHLLAPYGLVLLDPPYALEPADVLGLLVRLLERGHMADGCTVVYEHAVENAQTVQGVFGEDGRFESTGSKKCGKIGVSYLKARLG